eukprot:COSAG01_NODE_26385_length_715_cov_3.969156_1_plen_106_part_00
MCDGLRYLKPSHKEAATKPNQDGKKGSKGNKKGDGKKSEGKKKKKSPAQAAAVQVASANLPTYTIMGHAYSRFVISSKIVTVSRRTNNSNLHRRDSRGFSTPSQE